MKKITDKLILISLSILLSAIYKPLALPITVGALCITTLSMLNAILKYKYASSLSLLVYIIVCFFDPIFLIMLPVLFYDFDFKESPLSLLCLFSVVPAVYNFDAKVFCFFLVVAIISILASLNYYKIVSLNNKYYRLFDEYKEEHLKEQQAYKELYDKQFYKMESARLKERNDIACEIHDNVGHLLSSSIMLVGAMKIAETDTDKKETLETLESSLKKAMTSIRESVHRIHSDVVDLETELKNLLGGFTFCQKTFRFSLKTTLKNSATNNFVMIVKECLTNIIKHSNATLVTITVKEVGELVQLIVEDNGTGIKEITTQNVGLKSIKERVSSLGGTLSILTNNGFKVFTSFRKENLV